MLYFFPNLQPESELGRIRVLQLSWPQELVQCFGMRGEDSGTTAFHIFSFFQISEVIRSHKLHPGFPMVSCKFSLKPILGWLKLDPKSLRGQGMLELLTFRKPATTSRSDAPVRTSDFVYWTAFQLMPKPISTSRNGAEDLKLDIRKA